MKPSPLKGKKWNFNIDNSDSGAFDYEDIRSAVEYHREINKLVGEAYRDNAITTDEFLYWIGTLSYEEAFEDVMK